MKSNVRIVKRIMDIVIAGTGMILAAPLFLAIAIGIKLTSRGPIFYKQIRAGAVHSATANTIRDAPTFEMYKFRSMVPDAEKTTGAIVARKGDPRITAIGRFLRRARLDELPQLQNVLEGDMAMVGPRPERPELLANLAAAIPYFEERLLLVKPGITGLAQVKLSYTGKLPAESELCKYSEQLLNPYKLEAAAGALADDMRTKLLFDLVYSVRLENFWTFLRTDLGILLRTPLVMIMGKGR